MDCSSNTCQKMELIEQVQTAPRVIEAAEALACLLTGTTELQEFVRVARTVQTDPEVREIMGLIHGYYDVDAEPGDSFEELEERLESLPLIRKYHAAEQSVREILTAVDQVISEAAGVSFALNAQASGCG